MHFTLNRLAEGRRLNKLLLEIFVVYTDKSKNFWFENSSQNNLLENYWTNTWYTEDLLKEFEEFSKPANFIKALIINETVIEGINLKLYEKEFENVSNIISQIFSHPDQKLNPYNKKPIIKKNI